MRVRIFDCWMHEHDIREALRRPSADDELDGPDSRAGARRDGGQHGFRRRQAGRGARRVAGAARADRAAGAHASASRSTGGPRWSTTSAATSPTATIRLDGLLFTRLAGGRHDRGRAHSRTSTYGGDEAVAAADRRAPELRDLTLGLFNRWPLLCTDGRWTVLPKVGRGARG